MTQYNRSGYRWNINECIRLQREFELLELSIDEIADRHKRTPNAIMFKLSSEGFADYNVLYSNYHGLNTTIPTQKTQATQAKQSYDCEEEEVDQDDEDEEHDEDEPFDLDYNPNDEEDEDEDEEDEEEDEDDLKAHVIRLEKQVMMLTDMIMKSTKNKSLFSLFS